MLGLRAPDLRRLLHRNETLLASPCIGIIEGPAETIEHVADLGIVDDERWAKCNAVAERTRQQPVLLRALHRVRSDRQLESNASFVSLFLTSSIAPTSPIPRTSPTSGCCWNLR